MHFILDYIFGLMSGRFLLPTWTPWTQFGTSGLAPNAFFRVFWEINFWSHFGTNLAPFWHPRSNKIHPKIDYKKHPKMIDFWIDCLPKLAPFWDPSWDPRAAQDGPKTPPRRSQDATKTGQEPQEHPRSKFGSILVDVWSIFDWFLIYFWSMFDPFWFDFWLIFG